MGRIVLNADADLINKRELLLVGTARPWTKRFASG